MPNSRNGMTERHQNRPARQHFLVAFLVIGAPLLLFGCADTPSVTYDRATAGIDNAAPASAISASSTATVAGVAAISSPTIVWVSTVPRITTPGQSVALAGQGFAPNEGLAVTLLDSSGNPIDRPFFATSDLRGALSSMVLPVPAGIAPGTYNINVEARSSEQKGQAVLWIQSSSPAVVLSRDSAHPEETLTISANGFAPNERVVIYFEGQGANPITALAADGQGNVNAQNVVLPIIPPGSLQIIAAGSASMAQAHAAFQMLSFEPVVSLNANNIPPGEAVGFFGAGFAARDTVAITLEGSNEPHVTLKTDDRGRLLAPEAFHLPPDVKGQQAFIMQAQISGATVHVTFQVVPSYPLVELSDYFGRPGSQLTLSVRYLRPRERLDVSALIGGQRRKLGSFRADDNGRLPKGSSFQIPSDAPPGTITLNVDGEAARPPLRAKYVVTQ